MRQSDLRNGISDKEFKLILNQRHVDQVWELMKPNVDKYADSFLMGIAESGNSLSAQTSYSLWVQKLIMENESLHDKYHDIFDLEAMEEYEEVPNTFKSVVLGKQCPVIRHSLQSKAESMREWKQKYFACKGETLCDSFYNMMSFAAAYDEEMNEQAIDALDAVKDCRLNEMENDESEYGRCYISGVLGFGIVSNILNHMYPRTFPGEHKAGVWSLYFLAKGSKELMPSGTSEFSMLKDNHPNHVKVYEMEHNFFFAYEVFCIYTLRIWRVLAPRIEALFGTSFPTDYRFLLTNKFYEHVTSENRANIATLAGNDDVLKFSTPW